MASHNNRETTRETTLYIGNLPPQTTDPLIWELFTQAAPVSSVHLPRDRVTQTHQGYGFVEFNTEEDAEYAAKIMNQIRVWGKPVRVNKASADRRNAGGPPGAEGDRGGGVGAELFVGNLDSLVDEKVLYETFSRFGPLLSPPSISRDATTNLSKGYGFISYASFEASDDAIANMHGQYLSNKEITVQYAYKKDGKGERHGDKAERDLAASAKRHGVSVAIPAMPAALVLPSGAPQAPAAMNGFPPTPMSTTPQPPPSYNYGAYPPPASAGGYAPPPQQGGYGSMPPPPGGFPPPPQPNGRAGYNQSPLQAPPGGAGLPARPPPSMGGYGGPPPGFPPQGPPGGYRGGQGGYGQR